MPARRIGFHVSMAGGLEQAVARAVERGCTALQTFCGNPRGWTFGRRGSGEVAAFREARAEADLSPYVVHACYLINVCAGSRDVFDRSVRRLADELALSARLGADYYVLHPGSHKGKPPAWGVARAAEGIGAALGRAGRAPMILLENMASPHGPGGDLELLGDLVRRLDDPAGPPGLGVAIDSCHAFGAGYDLRRTSEVQRLVEDVVRHVGIERLRLLHVNDSRDEAGSRRDRHEHIGKGVIGRQGLRNLLNHPDLANLPLVLETPWESVAADRRNLRAVLRLLADR